MSRARAVLRYGSMPPRATAKKSAPSTSGALAVAPAAGAPVSKRGRKRKCPHAQDEGGPTKASACKRCAAERKALQRRRGKVNTIPKELVVPKRRALTIAEEIRLEKSKESLWGKRYVSLWESLGGALANDDAAHATIADILSSARSTEARKCRITPKEAIAPLWAAVDLAHYPQTSAVDPFCGSLGIFASWHHHHIIENRRRGAGKSGNAVAALPAPSNNLKLATEVQKRLAETPAAKDSDDDSDDDLALAALLPNAKRAQPLNPVTWQCSDLWNVPGASAWRRAGELKKEGGSRMAKKKDALDPYEPFSTISRQTAFVFDPPEEAADAAFVRFASYQARVTAVLLWSTWADAEPRKRLWAAASAEGRGARIPTDVDAEGVGGKGAKYEWFVVFKDDVVRRRMCEDEKFWVE